MSSTLEAMTNNERLGHFGLLDAFDRAARNRDRAEMVALLAQARVRSPEQVADWVLNDPEKYGF